MEYHQTSVSLREKSYRRLKAAQLIFARHGIHWGEGEIISQFVDFAIRVFIPRFVEMYLYKPLRWPLCQRLSAAPRVPIAHD